MALLKQRAAISNMTMHAADMHADNDLLHEAVVMELQCHGATDGSHACEVE